MKAQDLINILQQHPNADVSIVMGEDNCFEINPDLIYHTNWEGKHFIDIDIYNYPKKDNCYDFTSPLYTFTTNR